MNGLPLNFPDSYRDTLIGFGAIYEEWRLASEAALEAEDAVYRKYCEHRAGRGPGPSAIDDWEAARLRQQATEKLEQGMRALRASPL
jgi:hypothetical protein